MNFFDYFVWRSTEGSHYNFFVSHYGCDEPLIDRSELPKTVLNTFENCAAWGDPHIKGFGAAPKVDFMGVGSYVQAKSIARSLETHTYQCPYLGGTSIAVGVAIKSGPHLISFISGMTRINDTLYEEGLYSLPRGTVVEVGDNYVEVLGPTTISGYARVQANAWLRQDSPTGFIERIAIDLPKASTVYATGQCSDPATFVQVTDDESIFTQDAL